MQHPTTSPKSRLWYMDLFGTFRLECGTRPVQFRNRIAGYILAYLLLHPRHEERRERIQAAFWPDDSEEDGANNLRVTLSRMRSAFQPLGVEPPVEISPSHVRVHPERFACDVLEFDRNLALAAGLPDSPERIRFLRQAVSHYREPMLIETDFEWVREARYLREEKYVAALRELFVDARKSDRQTDAVDYAVRLLREDPYQDEIQDWLDSRRDRMRTEMREIIGTDHPTNPVPDFPVTGPAPWLQHPLAVSIRRWISSDSDQGPRIEELPAGEFHIPYAILLDSFLSAPSDRFDKVLHHVLDEADIESSLAIEAKASRTRGKQRLVLIDATALPHDIPLPLVDFRGKVLLIRSNPESNDFLPNGYHVPYYVEPSSNSEIYNTSIIELQLVRSICKALTGECNPRPLGSEVGKIADATNGQVNLCVSVFKSRLTRKQTLSPIAALQAVRHALSISSQKDNPTREEHCLFKNIASEPSLTSLNNEVPVRDGSPFSPKFIIRKENWVRSAWSASLSAEEFNASTMRWLAMSEQTACSRSFPLAEIPVKIIHWADQFLSQENNLALSRNLSRIIYGVILNSKVDCDIAAAFSIHLFNLQDFSTARNFATLIDSNNSPNLREISSLVSILSDCKDFGKADSALELIRQIKSVNTPNNLYKYIISNCSMTIAFHGTREQLTECLYLFDSHSALLPHDTVYMLCRSFLAGRHLEQIGKINQALPKYQSCATNLQAVNNRRLLSYVQCHQDRVEIILNRERPHAVRLHTCEAFASFNPQLILGHLVNLCRVTKSDPSKGYVHGYARQLMAASPPFIANQFASDFADAVRPEFLDDDEYRNAFHHGMNADQADFSSWLLNAVIE